MGVSDNEKSNPQDSTKPVAGFRQCVVITRSPGRSPPPSMKSSSGGQPPSSARSQKAGQTPVPTGIFERISKYPYFCENELWVVRMPDMYSLLKSTDFSSGGVRLATIDRTPSRILNGSSPSGVVARPPYGG